jgi:hypothetical protein
VDPTVSVNNTKNNKIGKVTLWNAMKYERLSSCHVTGFDVSRAAKGTINPTMIT